MSAVLSAPFWVWGVAALATLGVIARPFQWPEAVWAVLGALILCATGMLPWSQAWHAIGQGSDVYLFLIGMMMASELARQEGLFDFLAALAARRAAGSARRLFFLLYCVGVVVTVFMSNDATAVVLTPAVLAVTRGVRARNPLPYLYICAFVANAASFVLPISNPANLVIFQHRMPTLLDWLQRFALPSLSAIVATGAVLYVTQRAALEQPLAAQTDLPPLSSAGKITALGIVAMAAVMLAASALNLALGWPTCAAGVVLFGVLCRHKRRFLASHLQGISWRVLPLVAGLFVLVAGLQHTGVVNALAAALGAACRHAPRAAPWYAAVATALSSNLINNLPAGLIAGSTLAIAHAPAPLANTVLIGVDLGPNLSVTGSLATLLWLGALRREGIEVGARAFLKLGVVVSLPALAGTLATLALQSR
jgi:arsenical pump membrane protein